MPLNKKFFPLFISVILGTVFTTIINALILGLSFTFFSPTVLANSGPSANLTYNAKVVAKLNTTPSNLADKMVSASNRLGNNIVIKYVAPQPGNQVKQRMQRYLKNSLGANFDQAKNRIQDVDADTQVITFANDSDLKKGLEAALQNPEVDYAQPIYTYRKQAFTPADPEFNTNQWYLKDGISTLNLQSGWEYLGQRFGVTCATAGSGLNCGGKSSIKVAVIDSGVNPNVKDAPNFDTTNSLLVYSNPNNSCAKNEESVFLSGVALAGPAGTTYVNFCKKTGINNMFDDDGHGTAVAGVISMPYNNKGGVGVAFNNTILPVGLHGDYTWNSLVISEAVKYVVRQGVSVINMSFGGPGYDPLLERVINNATNQGVVVVAAAGNCGVWVPSSCDFNDNGRPDPNEINPILYPAGYQNVIAVGASNYGTNTNPYDPTTNPQGVARSAYSEHNSSVFVVAPVGDGSNSPSGVWAQCGYIPTYFGAPCYGKNISDFDAFIGTSFSAPAVAGTVGLMKSLNPDLNTNAIKSLLAATATDVGQPGYDVNFGYGVVNVNKVLREMFEGWQSDKDGETIGKPDTVSFKGKIYQAVLGTDNIVYTRSSSSGSSDSWSGWSTGAIGRTNSAVTMVGFKDKLYQAVRGLDNKIYTRVSVDGTTWEDWIVDPVSDTSDAVEMVVFKDKIYQMARGTGDKIYTRFSSDGTVWDNWEERGGTTPNAVAAVVFNNQICQAVRGSTDSKIYTRCSSDGTNWPAWEKDEGSYTPQAVSMAANSNYLYQTATGTGNLIYVRRKPISGNWGAWTEQSGQTFSTPDLTIHNNKIFQTVRGIDNKVYWRIRD
jgi:subtilisin family serine protease